MKRFQEPEMTVKLFVVEDVITTSLGGEANGSEGSGVGGGAGM